jgi:hypothetical protein
MGCREAAADGDRLRAAFVHTEWTSAPNAVIMDGAFRDVDGGTDVNLGRSDTPHRWSGKGITTGVVFKRQGSRCPLASLRHIERLHQAQHHVIRRPY